MRFSPARRRSPAVAPALCALLALVACSESAPQTDEPVNVEALRRIVTDDGGVEHRMGRPRDRVISLVPSITDFILAFDRGGRLIARTRYDEDPSLANLQSVGGGLDPSVERIVFLQPDLVIAWPDAGERSIVARLEELGVTVYQARVETIEDARRHAVQVGALLGVRPTAQRWVADLDSTFARMERKLGEAPRPSALFVASSSPPIVAGSGTFVDSLITLAGGRNTFGDASSPWPQVSLEAVARRRPDFVLVPSATGVDTSLRGGGWSAVSGRRQSVDPVLFGRPGPHLAEAATTLFRLFHPDLVP